MRWLYVWIEKEEFVGVGVGVDVDGSGSCHAMPHTHI